MSNLKSRYLHTGATRRLLQEEGFLYHMGDYSADAPFWGEVDGSDRPMVVVPYQLDTKDMKMWVAPSYLPKDWLDYAVDSFDTLYAEGAHAPKVMSLGLRSSYTPPAPVPGCSAGVRRRAGGRGDGRKCRILRRAVGSRRRP